ncbi:VanZ family protein [Lacticaseibacillus daqingensis]|uniref:VanZ family protein n=1 Tax=Lacticaseibacillus daqingensis TaxID=2486014 RepID=UPI00384C7A65
MTLFRKYNWLWLSLAIIGVLFISSSMTYQQQTVVPLLDGIVPKNAPFAWLRAIDFTYAGTQVSAAALGFPAFCEWFLRKGAHFTIFLCFGFATARGLRGFIRDRGLTAIVALLSSTGVAALDEFHQMLTQNRTPLFQDVMLDTCGALVGVVLAIALRQRRRGR